MLYKSYWSSLRGRTTLTAVERLEFDALTELWDKGLLWLYVDQGVRVMKGEIELFQTGMPATYEEFTVAEVRNVVLD